jgi:hypothetical protein
MDRVRAAPLYSLYVYFNDYLTTCYDLSMAYDTTLMYTLLCAS